MDGSANHPSIRGGDEPYVDGRGPDTTNARDATILEDAQQLDRRRQYWMVLQVSARSSVPTHEPRYRGRVALERRSSTMHVRDAEHAGSAPEARREERADRKPGGIGDGQRSDERDGQALPCRENEPERRVPDVHDAGGRHHADRQPVELARKPRKERTSTLATSAPSSSIQKMWRSHPRPSIARWMVPRRDPVNRSRAVCAACARPRART